MFTQSRVTRLRKKLDETTTKVTRLRAQLAQLDADIYFSAPSDRGAMSRPSLQRQRARVAEKLEDVEEKVRDYEARIAAAMRLGRYL